MLGRTADSLYWMVRYVERAENTARLLDVGQRMSLVSHDPKMIESTWHSALEVTGTVGDYYDRHGVATEDEVISFLALDRENPASIWSSIRAARENARALRGSITTEMWECLNGTWLEVRNLAPERAVAQDNRVFFDWVKERAHLFRGIASGTILRDEAYHFIRLGWRLEQAGNTARILDAKYHILLPEEQEIGGAVDYYQWGALLRSVNAFRAYHKVFSSEISPYHVAELLIVRRDLPRSLHSCLAAICDMLEALRGGRSFESRRLAGEIHARVAYARMDSIFEQGLHEFLTEFIDDGIALGAVIENDFMMQA